MMKEFRVQSSEFRKLVLMVAVLAAVFFTIPTPIYAQASGTIYVGECVDSNGNPASQDCHTCDPDDDACPANQCVYHGALRYNPGSTWAGECKTGSPGVRYYYVCDPGNAPNYDTASYVPTGNDFDCGNALTSPAPASSIKDIFGKISPPVELNPFIAKGGNGAGGISAFLNGLISLIYIFASVVFIFMLLWGALQWTMSGGDKEAVASARRRITFAFIGIVLFAIAFAIIKVVGTFTGFDFVSRQNASCSQVEQYRLEGPDCMHFFYPDTNCTLVTEKVDKSFCN